MENARRDWLRRGGLFGKYVVAFVGLVVFVLAVNVALETWAMYRETTVAVANSESEKAEATAHRIDQFLEEIERQISWVTRASVTTLDQRRADYIQTLQRSPAVDGLVMLDTPGRGLFPRGVVRPCDRPEHLVVAGELPRRSALSDIRDGPSRPQRRRHRRAAQLETPRRLRQRARGRQGRLRLPRRPDGPPARELGFRAARRHRPLR